MLCLLCHESVLHRQRIPLLTNVHWSWKQLQQQLVKHSSLYFLDQLLRRHRRHEPLHPILIQYIVPYLFDERIHLSKVYPTSNVGTKLCALMWSIIYNEITATSTARVATTTLVQHYSDQGNPIPAPIMRIVPREKTRAMVDDFIVSLNQASNVKMSSILDTNMTGGLSAKSIRMVLKLRKQWCCVRIHYKQRVSNIKSIDNCISC